jgi:lysyl-tRNA synthetase class I
MSWEVHIALDNRRDARKTMLEVCDRLNETGREWYSAMVVCLDENEKLEEFDRAICKVVEV